MADIVLNPPENIRLKAADMAAYNTFTNEPGAISKKLMQFRNAIDDATTVPLGTMLLPFINTPGNIMKFTFERTPLAFLMKKVRADIAAGGVRRDLALARIGFGTVLVSSALDLALDGHITGSGPTDDKEFGKRQALRRGGWQPYSIRVRTGGTDENPEYRWFAYNRLDPVGSHFAMAAELADIMRNTDGRQSPQIEEALSAMVLGASQTYLNKSYFSGLANAIAAVQNPERYGEGWFTRLASSFVPTGVAEVTRVMDPIQRHNTSLVESIKRRTPGLSKEVPPRLTFWGDEISYQSGLGTLYDVVSPIYSSANNKAKDIDREFFRLDYYPTHPGSLRVEGKNISLRNDPEIKNRIIALTAKEKASQLVDSNWDDLSAKKGGGKAALNRLMAYGDQTLPETLAKVIDGSDPERGLEYLQADEDEKKNLLADVIRAYRSAAQVQVLREFPDLIKRRAQIPTRGDLAEEAPF
ncbi:MAG: hypothetical protein AB7S74_01890 [Hyphomicrobium sp.]